MIKHLVVLGLVLLSAFLVWHVSIRLGVEETLDSSIWWNIMFLVLGIILVLKSGINLLEKIIG